MPKVSIIVPVYNVEKYLSKCLDNLINQTLKDIEIICVNDGSKDSSAEILEKYAQKDKRIVVLNQENAGLSAARNNGMDIAKGEYIGFVDSDDWVDPDFYAKLIDAAERHDADVACGSIIRERRHSRKFRIHYTKEECFIFPQEKIDAARVPDMCYVWNKIYRAEYLNNLKLRFIEGMFFEDVDFVTRAVYFSNKIVTVADTFYHYWTNSNSTVKTMRKSDKKRMDSLLSKKYVLEFFRKYNLTSRPRNLIKKKNCIKFFGLTILKTYEWETRKVYYLFGAIPIMEKISYA